MAKNITFFIWGAITATCWTLVSIYSATDYPVVAVAIAIGAMSTVLLIITGGFAIAEHWNDGKK